MRSEKERRKDEQYFERILWFLQHELRMSYKIELGEQDGQVESVLVKIPRTSLGYPHQSMMGDVFQRYPKTIGKLRDIAWKDGLIVSQGYETSTYACIEFDVDRSWVGKTIGVLRFLSLI